VKVWCLGLLALLLGLATGCAGSGRSGDAPVAVPAVEVVAPAPPPPVSVLNPSFDRSESRAALAPAPRERPGLGTEWGEDRDSPIHDVEFTRADERRPLATTELRYDDARGVSALAAYVRDRGRHTHQSSAAGGAITIWIEDGRHRPLDVVDSNGHVFVIGEAGERYSIFLQNQTGHRFEAVTTVDGLDVMNGQPGSLSNRGYLLMPYATLEIDGFRRSEDVVAAFRFGRVADSYAAEVGSARDVGVIGVAFFGERGDSWFPGRGDDDVRTRATATPFPADRFAAPPGW
jgi:hypothetical protein